MLNTATAILDAIGGRKPLTIAYRKPNGIVNIRTCRPYAVEACANGSTIMRAVCAHQDEPRSFTVANILHASAEGLAIAIAPNVCTGAVSGGGYVSHNGDTCPVHEA